MLKCIWVNKVKIIEIENGIALRDIEHFDPAHIFPNGQAFRWSVEEDESYTLVAHNRVINLKRVGADVIIDNTNLDDFTEIWYDYFDLSRDYGEIKTRLKGDVELEKAMEYGGGLRVLKQEPFETLITFIISANNQIPRIMKSVELIAQTYGKSLGFYRGREHFAFPSPEVLAKASVEEVREITRIGFRDKRVVDTSELIASGEVDLVKIFDMDRVEAREELMKFPGVGEKVADCVLLFAYNFVDSFPVDVWVNRIMETLYIKEPVSKKEVGDYGRRQFGDIAGIAQQYLFFYGRENKIGK